jgi:hypothetical protein
MVLENAKQWYKNQTGSEFKHLHWWEAVRHQLKWRARSVDSSTTDPFLSSSEAATEEEVTRPIGWDRAKVVAWKGKGKEGSSSQSESSSAMGGIISTLKKLNTSFTNAQMWKQYNKLWDRSAANMDDKELASDDKELASHREALIIEKDLHFVTWNAVEV